MQSSHLGALFFSPGQVAEVPPSELPLSECCPTGWLKQCNPQGMTNFQRSVCGRPIPMCSVMCFLPIWSISVNFVPSSFIIPGRRGEQRKRDDWIAEPNKPSIPHPRYGILAVWKVHVKIPRWGLQQEIWRDGLWWCIDEVQKWWVYRHNHVPNSKPAPAPASLRFHPNRGDLIYMINNHGVTRSITINSWPSKCDKDCKSTIMRGWLRRTHFKR